MRLGNVKQFLGFDLETTGVNVDEDRIVTISMILRDLNSDDEDQENMTTFNPGIPIPPGATAINGITDEMVKDGDKPADELPFFHGILKEAWAAGIPIVGSNLPYDLSLFAAELQRHNDIKFEVAGPLLDTMVLHRMVSGQRKANLAAMCEYYKIENKKAHNSSSDVVTTLDILQEMISRSAYLRETDLRDLYVAQRQSHRHWAANMQQFFDRIGKTEQVNGDWPINRKWEQNG
jgi:DNA polymerase-3 subunit epsilon